MPSSPGDYYQRLRLSQNASRQEIKAAFRRLARQYHPDLHPNQPGALKQFRALREAYEVLVDRVQRQRYDQYQQGLSPQSPLNHPQTPSDFYIRGIRYVLARRYRAAIGDYSKAIELDHQFAEAYVRRAEARYLVKDDSGVLADCQRAIALNPTEPRTYYYQGMARYRLDYVQSAVAAFTDAIAHDPEEAQYHYRRGLAYQDLHQLDEAAKDFRKAASLYRQQGHIASYQQLQLYLRQFGTAGRSRPIKLLGSAAQKISRLVPHRVKATLGPKPPRPQRRASDFSPQASSRPQNIPQKSLIHPPVPPGHPRDRRHAQHPAQTYWAPGVSSRPDPNYRPRQRLDRHLISGAIATLRLLSNPAGEMVPFYRRLSARQTSLIGYALAVLANLAFVLGGIQHATTNSWLVASWLWASGGMTFVAMVLVLGLTRIFLRVRGLWVADIFILGAAVVPLGMMAVLSAIAKQFAAQITQPPYILFSNLFFLMATLWIVSQVLITLYSGLARIQGFSEQFAAWFTPVVLSLGLAAGVGTWSFLAL